MLTPLIPRGARSRERAYLVPWHVERLHDSHSLVPNAGATPLDVVRVFVHIGADHGGGGRVETHLWGGMMPGESAELCLCALDPDDCVVTVAWFRPHDGREYVWRYAP